jgi:hypothetical protein
LHDGIRLITSFNSTAFGGIQFLLAGWWNAAGDENGKHQKMSVIEYGDANGEPRGGYVI